MPAADLDALRKIAETEFSDIVRATTIVNAKLRVLLIDESYVDFWWSRKFPGAFACHWERRHIDGKIFRHDNAPHPNIESLSSHPQHFHNGSDTNVLESTLSQNPEEALRQFLTFAREVLTPR